MNCQTKLISSASDGYVCQGRHVVFNCEATGNTLSWSYNSDAIVDYTSFDGVGVQRYMSTDIYSALISNNAGVLVSELIFLSSPNPPSFVVECLAGGIPRSENISVLGKNVIRNFDFNRYTSSLRHTYILPYQKLLSFPCLFIQQGMHNMAKTCN